MSTRLRTRALLAAATLVIAFGLLVPAASAAPVLRRTFSSTLGTGARFGRATIWAYQAGDALSRLTVRHLRANTTYSVRVYAGSCSNLGHLAVALPSLRTDGLGTADRTLGVSLGKMNLVWKYARTQAIVIRFAFGTSVACGRLSYAVATRVAIPAYKINLPVVRPPGSTGTFPYCNVAQYFEALSQPDEPGVTLLFAHARIGMFLPLLTKSMVASGAAMVGKTVNVYLSTNKLYSYTVTQVRRHQTSIQSAVTATDQQLWLQTSEGPNASSKKLIIVARLVSVTPTTKAAAHPVPHPKVCR